MDIQTAEQASSLVTQIDKLNAVQDQMTQALKSGGIVGRVEIVGDAQTTVDLQPLNLTADENAQLANVLGSIIGARLDALNTQLGAL